MNVWSSSVWHITCLCVGWTHDWMKNTTRGKEQEREENIWTQIRERNGAGNGKLGLTLEQLKQVAKNLLFILWERECHWRSLNREGTWYDIPEKINLTFCVQYSSAQTSSETTIRVHVRRNAVENSKGWHDIERKYKYEGTWQVRQELLP